MKNEPPDWALGFLIVGFLEVALQWTIWLSS
ncbi:hypothetical protein GA0115250_1447105 [Streptomyces sp. BvitLS-983]|nr:hypothetical protein GA0115250_1447105 [Streptomyces sp. BvitLS-983]